MLNLKDINWKKPGLFAAGVAFGTAGIKILTSDDAKKLYTNCTAAVLRAKSCVMKTATSVQENAGDILAEAKLPVILWKQHRGQKSKKMGLIGRMKQ